MSDIVPWTPPPNPFSAATKERRRLEQVAEGLRQQEESRVQVAQARLAGGHQLSTHHVMRATQLDQVIQQVGRDRPFLEAQLRDHQQALGIAINMFIFDFLTGGR